MRVIVTGAGPAGAVLSPALRRHGIDVAVHERSAGPGARRLGYRINLDGTGCAALRDCLDRRARSAVAAVLHHQTEPVVSVRTADGTPVSSRRLPGPGVAVDRTALQRAVLGAGSDGVHWGSEAVDVTGPGSGPVRVRFSGGGESEADVVVGADGGRSAVRRAILPDVEPRPSGLTAVYGRTALPLAPGDGGDLVAEALTSRVTSLVDPATGDTVVLGGWNPGPAAREIVPDLAPYLMWVLITSAPVPSPGVVGLCGLVRDRLTGWTPELRRLVEATDPADTFPVPLVDPFLVPPWPSGRVTLVGDAAHPMTPAGGRGANLALADAARLVRTLVAADRDPQRRAALLADHDEDLRRTASAVLASSAPTSIHGR